MLISSDTNIWIDFFEINHPDHPFLLGHKYYLSSAAYDDELIPSDEKRRAIISSVTAQAGINPVILPTINVAAMLMSNDAIDLVQEKI